MKVKKIGILTAGGLAPCLSSAVAGLIEAYNQKDPSIQIIAYRNGYKGLLLGDSIEITKNIREKANLLHSFGGSPIGNSRVKLTNQSDCLNRGLVKEGQDPQEVASNQLVKDQIDVLHTIGGDDTNMAAAELAKFLAKKDYSLKVIGLPKTIDNDVFPIQQTLGAYTAAEEGAHFFANFVSEQSANPKMLLIHEVMGRSCGWLTVATAQSYRKSLKEKEFLPEIGLARDFFDIHGIYIPEKEVDLEAEANRLRQVMEQNDCVNIFISEGAGVESIVQEMESSGEKIPRDAFGHVKLDAVNPGKWFGKQFAKMIGAEKTLVQKSGYYSRAASANHQDLELIKTCTQKAVECAFKEKSGVIGHDEDRDNILNLIEFDRIKGGKSFDCNQAWFQNLLKDIGQQ